MRYVMSQHKEPFGFLTFAKNSDSVDYLRLAYLQALNIKATQTNNKFAVVVDPATYEKVEQYHRDVFDYVIEHPSNGPFDAEPDVFWVTPFKETVKLESDLLFTRSIDHWIHAFRLRDVVLSHGCKDYMGNLAKSRKYRQFFDDNKLPDVYNGLMYFRYSRSAMDFFAVARQVRDNWQEVKKQFKNCMEDTPSTDVLYAITARIVGEETCTLPSLDFINFVHMKSGIQGWGTENSWLDTVAVERDADMLRINNLNQYHPVHYYDKNYATDDLIKYYEQRNRIT